MAALIFAPGFGGGLAEFSLQTPFFVSGGLALFGLILGFFYIVEPSTISDVDSVTNPSSSEEKDEKEVLVEEDPVKVKEELAEIAAKDAALYNENKIFIRLLWFMSFAANLGFRIIITMLALWVNYKFGWTTKEFAFMMSGLGGKFNFKTPCEHYWPTTKLRGWVE